MSSTPIALSKLPDPTIIDALDFEAMYDATTADFLTRWAARRAADPSLPEITTLCLESDSMVVELEAYIGREAKLRQRVNEAARAQLLAFAEGNDLEHLAAFYDVYRMAGEGDDRLRQRIILEIQGRSSGGPPARYKAVAMAADIRVASVNIYRNGRSPVINVAIYSTAPDGVASADLIAKVQSALESDKVQLVNDTIVVASAVRNVVNLAADIWLLPDADDATVTRASTELRTAWAAEQALGRDLNVSWWTSKLMIAGVAKIVPTASVTDVEAPDSEAIAIGAISLNLRGRLY